MRLAHTPSSHRTGSIRRAGTLQSRAVAQAHVRRRAGPVTLACPRCKRWSATSTRSVGDGEAGRAFADQAALPWFGGVSAAGVRGDDRLGGPSLVPCADLVAQAVGELWPGWAVAERAQLPSALPVAGGFETTQGEVGQGGALDDGGAAEGDGGGAQGRLNGGGGGGDAA